MKKVTFLFFSLIVTLCGVAQTSQVPEKLLPQVLFSVDTVDVTVEEFLWFNKKYNSNADEKLRLPLEEYYKLFAEYKMKVLEAESQELDTSAAFAREFQSYLKPTIQKFIFKEDIEKDFIKLEHERLGTDIEVQHIFVRCDKYANPKDTLAAYMKAKKAKQEILNGKSFAKCAEEISEDNFSNKKGGYIGYITAFLKPLEYENAVYKAKKGDVIGPISTRYGYYVVQVLNKRESLGKRKASLLILYASDKDSNWTSQKVLADSIHTAIKSGASFDDLSKTYNINPRLQQKNGDIGWIDNSMRYPDVLKEALLEIDSVGGTSKPLKVEFGYIIAKVADIGSRLTLEETADALKKVYDYDVSRIRIKQRIVYDSLRQATKVKIYHDNLAEFIADVNTSILVQRWVPKIYTKKEDKVLFTYADRQATFSQFAKYLQQRQRNAKISDKEILVRFRFAQFIDQMMEYYALTELPKQNKEFAMITQEYHDGMIMYEILQQEVYYKAATDTLGLEAFYRSNATKYMQQEGVDVTYFYCKDKKAISAVTKCLKKRETKSVTDNEIVKIGNKKSIDNVILDKVIHYRGENKAIDSLQWKAGNYYVKDNKVIVINKYLPSSPMPLEKCRIKVIADYQFWLEDRWKEKLHTKYKSTLNKNLFIELLKYAD